MSDRNDQGFTLLEVLVAFIILAGALLAANQSIIYSVRAFSAATDARSAAVMAEDLFATARIAMPTSAVSEGDRDGYHWRLTVDSVETGAAFGGLQVVRLRVDIHVPSGRRIGSYTTFRALPETGRGGPLVP